MNKAGRNIKRHLRQNDRDAIVMQAVQSKQNETLKQGSILWSVPLSEARDMISIGRGGWNFGE